MKSILIGLLTIVWGCTRAQERDYVLLPDFAQRVPVSAHRVTTLIFNSTVIAGFHVTRDVAVEKVRGLENVLAIRATRPGFMPTNLAVFGADGRTYSFDLEFSDTAVAWEYRVRPGDSNSHRLVISGQPADAAQLRRDARVLEARPGWMRAVCNKNKIRFSVTGLYYADSLFWLVGTIRNRSNLDFRVERVRLFTVNRKRVKRMALQEADIQPVYAHQPTVVAGKAAQTFALAYREIAVADGKRLLMEFAEGNEGRTVRLSIPLKKLLAARKLEVKSE